MARNLTSLLFADGLWRVVWEEPSGKQYVVVDDDGTREYGVWYIPQPADEEPYPDAVVDELFRGPVNQGHAPIPKESAKGEQIITGITDLMLIRLSESRDSNPPSLER
jgi:hypothetical protein